MTRRFIAPALAAALALTPLSSAPARAGDAEDVAAAIIGTTAFFLLLKELDDNGKKAKHKSPPPPHHGGKPPKGPQGQGGHPYPHGHGGNSSYHGSQGHAQQRSIPNYCLQTVNTHNGPRTVASEYCLRQAGLYRLPQQCEFLVPSGRHGGKREVYGLNCLSRSGYRVEARHH